MACFGPDARGGRFLPSWLALSLLFITLAAWRSVGHYHSDEQFQTLEFAAAKLGLTREATLPWEHGLRMRPWLQPGLYFVIVSALRKLGLEDPFAWATCLRLVSGLYGWTALVGLALCTRNWLDDLGSRRIAIKLTSVFCLLPVLLVRTSSESLATSSFFLGLALFELGTGDRDHRGGGWLFLTGALFGLAFEFRYPVGLMVAGWFAWAALVRRRPVGDLITVGIGVVSVISAAAFVDRWGYGDWSFPPWNFVVENLRAGRAAERFGALPPWGYLTLLLRSPWAPAASLAALVTAVAWLRHPRHVFTWCGVPMLLVQSLIAHKELRFLAPLIPLATVSFGLALAPGRDRLEPLVRFWRSASASGPRRLLFAANAIALTGLCLAPASPLSGLQRFVYEQLPAVSELFVLGPGSPYGPTDLIGRFYLPPGLEVRVLAARELRETLQRSRRPCHVAVRGGLSPQLLGPGVGCRELYRSIPAALDGLPGIRPLDRWTLFRCEPPLPRPQSSRPVGPSASSLRCWRPFLGGC